MLGPHVLTTLLLPALAASGHGRILTVSTLAAGGLDLSDTQYQQRRYSGIGAYRASKQASRMLTWALADRLRDTLVTAKALNPGYVLTDLTRNVGGLLKIVVVLTSFRAQTALDGADTAIWLAAQPRGRGDDGQVLEQAARGAVQVPGPGGGGAAVDAGRAAGGGERMMQRAGRHVEHHSKHDTGEANQTSDAWFGFASRCG